MIVKASGLRGTGMSYAPLRIAEMLQERFDLPEADIVFTPEELLKKVKNTKKQSIIFIDGGENVLSKRELDLQQKRAYEQLKRIGWEHQKIMLELLRDCP